MPVSIAPPPLPSLLGPWASAWVWGHTDLGLEHSGLLPGCSPQGGAAPRAENPLLGDPRRTTTPSSTSTPAPTRGITNASAYTTANSSTSASASISAGTNVSTNTYAEADTNTNTQQGTAQYSKAQH